MFKGDYESDRIKDPNSQGEGHQRYDFEVVLKNQGPDTLIVPKVTAIAPASLVETHNMGAISYQLGCLWEIPDLAPGVLDIPSESELALVKLLPGESTSMHILIRSDKNLDENNVTFIYFVGSRMSARFKTWSGRLETKVMSQLQRRLDNEQKRRAEKNKTGSKGP